MIHHFFFQSILLFVFCALWHHTLSIFLNSSNDTQTKSSSNNYELDTQLRVNSFEWFQMKSNLDLEWTALADLGQGFCFGQFYRTFGHFFPFEIFVLSTLFKEETLLFLCLNRTLEVDGEKKNVPSRDVIDVSKHTHTHTHTHSRMTSNKTKQNVNTSNIRYSIVRISMYAFLCISWIISRCTLLYHTHTRIALLPSTGSTKCFRFYKYSWAQNCETVFAT